MPLNRIALIEHAIATGALSVEGNSIQTSGVLSTQIKRALGIGDRDWDRSVGRIQVDTLPGPAVMLLNSAIAKRRILEKYAQLGGVQSELGLQIDSKLRSENGRYYLDYRGGQIEVKNLNMDPNAGAVGVVQRKCEIWLTGIRCHLHQESSIFVDNPDEIYGSILTVTPGAGTSKSIKFPSSTEIFDMGNHQDFNFVSMQEAIWEGPPSDVIVTCILVEKDSGDIEDFKRKIAEQALRLGAAVAGGGAAVEEATKDDSFANDVTLGIVNAIVQFVGASDDPYVPETIRFSWTDFASASFTKRKFKETEYTNSVILTGTDDGGSKGKYELFFDVWISEVRKVI